MGLNPYWVLMARKKKISESPVENEKDEYVRTGGPLKFYNRRRILKRFRLPSLPEKFEPISAEWFQNLTQEIVAARRKKHLTQKALAKLLGTTQSEISRLETGDANPTAEFLDRLFTSLELKIEIIIK